MTRQENTITLTCACAACASLPDVTAAPRVLDGGTGAAFRAQVAHTYVQYAAGTSPLAAVMCARYDVAQVQA